jgi:hypothetical protein
MGSGTNSFEPRKVAAMSIAFPRTDAPAGVRVAADPRAAEFRTVSFRETNYRTGSVTVRNVEAPVIERFTDHVLVRLPDGASLRVQEKRR